MLTRFWNILALKTNRWEQRVHLILLIGILLVFIGYAALFAFRTQTHTIPDEIVHFELSKHYATALGIPPDVPETYQFGHIQRQPFLYYWLNGRIINAIKIFWPAISNWKLMVLLRLVNVAYSLAGVIFCYLLAVEVTRSRWWPLFVVFLLTNTLMFVFLSGGINYDNLSNLLSFAGVYFLARVWNGKNFVHNSLAWLTNIAAGCLVKITVLPLALVMLAAWAFYIFKNRETLTVQFPRGWKTTGLIIIFLALVGLNVSLYGVNLIRYRTLTVPCAKILTEEQCNQSGIVRREKLVSLPEKLTLVDVIEKGKPDPVEWFLDFWIPVTLKHIYGIKGHIEYVPDLPVTFYRLFILGVVLTAVRYWKRPVFPAAGLLAIFVFYLLVLLRTNYQAELSNDFLHLGIQGRYLFPVIGVIYVLTAYSFSLIPSKRLSQAVLVLTILLFVLQSPPVTLHTIRPNYLPRQAIRSEGPIGEIAGEVEVAQDFTSYCYGTIDQVELLFTTYGRANHHPVIVRLTDLDSGQVLMDQIIPAAAIVQGPYHALPVQPVPDSFGRIYRISITSPESLPGDAFSIFTNQEDMFPQVEALRNGVPTGNDLVFRYQCLQPVLNRFILR